MELSEKQKIDLKKFSKLLNALNMEDGVEWVYRHYDEWDPYDPGPYYRGKNVSDEISFLPRSIEEFFEEIKNNFDTDLFYNDYYDSYNGGLQIFINAEKEMIIVKYYYYTMNTESSEIENTFLQLAQETNPWRSNERDVLKLTDENFIEKMKKDYGSFLTLEYDGSGDSGYISDYGQTNHGSVKTNQDIEYIAYEILEQYHAGWEINEGSSGHMIFDFEKQEFKIAHYQNIEEEVEDYYKSFSYE